MFDLPEEYRDLIEFDHDTPFSKWQVQNSAGQWITLEDVIQSRAGHRRDDDRQIGYTSLPPAGTASIVVDNPRGRYSYEQGTRFSDLLVPDRRVRKFTAFKLTGERFQHVYQGPKGLLDASRPSVMWHGFDENYLSVGFGFDAATRKLTARKGRREGGATIHESLPLAQYDVSAYDESQYGAIETAVYGSVYYGQPFYGLGSIYVSTPFDVGVLDREFAVPDFDEIKVSFDAGTPGAHRVFILGKTWNDPDQEPGPWVFLGEATSGVGISPPWTMGGRMFRYAIAAAVNWDAAELPTINSVEAKFAVDWIAFPRFNGFLTRPSLDNSTEESRMTFNAQDSFKKLVEQNSGGFHLQGTGETPAGTDLDVSQVVRQILLQAGFHDDDMVLEETGVIVEVGAGGLSLDPAPYREHLAAAMQIAQRQADKDGGYELFTYYLTSDATGRWVLARALSTEVAGDVLSHNDRLSGEGISRDQDDSRIINKQTVFGHKEVETFPEEKLDVKVNGGTAVPTVTVALSKTELEKTFDIEFVPSISGAAVTNIRIVNNNPYDTVAWEVEEKDESDPTNFSRTKTTMKLRVRNKDVEFEDVTTTIDVYGTPVDPGFQFVGESVQPDSVDLVDASGAPTGRRFGVRAGSDINNPLVTNAEVAQNLSKAIVRYNALPRDRVSARLTIAMPHLELNTLYRIFEPFTNTYKLFFVTAYEESDAISNNEASFNASAEFESANIDEAEQTWDFSRSPVPLALGDLRWDSGRLFDQNIDAPETTPEYESVFS